MSNGIGMIIESLVAILLMLTIGYCMLLNRRLKLLKADEQALRATISELVTATEIAERAIGGLKLTVRECDAGLGERLSRAERICADLDRKLAAGKEYAGRLPLIATVGRRPESRRPPRQRSAGHRGGRASLRRAAAHQGVRSRGMIRYIRDLRLIPIALIASACLLALKTADLVLDGGHWLRGRQCAGGRWRCVGHSHHAGCAAAAGYEAGYETVMGAADVQLPRCGGLGADMPTSRRRVQTGRMRAHRMRADGCGQTECRHYRLGRDGYRRT